MTRPHRIEGEGVIHHVVGNAIPEQAAFPDDEARRGFLSLLTSVARKLGWHVLAYCLLSTHYHVLLETEAPNLGTGMRTLHGRHTAKLNARLERRGHLWRSRYHDTVVRTESHLVWAAAYIDVNPVAAGICDDPAAWPWSSYRANAGLAEPWSWHRPNRLYDHMGAPRHEAPAVYGEFVSTIVNDALKARAEAKASQGVSHLR